MIDYKKYFDCLHRCSGLSLMYRIYCLYPKLCSNLDGRASDLGCGIGDLHNYYKNIVGVDINPETVKYCRLLGLDVYLMEIYKLPFE
jgi:SAM-dependent methyltransferase